MTAHPTLSILVVTYRTPELTTACLRSIYDNAPADAFEILLFDNDPSDGTTDLVARTFPEVRTFPSEDNVGFAAANNALAAHAKGDYLLLLNSDTVVHHGSLQAILDFARGHPQGGLYGGRTVRPSGELDPSSCWGRQTLWSLSCFALCLSHTFRGNRWLDPESLGSWRRDSVREVGVISGCLALMPADLWRQIGGFDERFWMYGEDQDLALRVSRLDYRPVITPEAVITHVVGASSSGGSKHIFVLKAKVTLMQKHWSRTRRVIGTRLLLCGCLLRRLTTPRGSAWRRAWAEREDWMSGYAPRAGGTEPKRVSSGVLGA
jgi:hypothetical protein